MLDSLQPITKILNSSSLTLTNEKNLLSSSPTSLSSELPFFKKSTPPLKKQHSTISPKTSPNPIKSSHSTIQLPPLPKSPAPKKTPRRESVESKSQSDSSESPSTSPLPSPPRKEKPIKNLPTLPKNSTSKSLKKSNAPKDRELIAKFKGKVIENYEARDLSNQISIKEGETVVVYDVMEDLYFGEYQRVFGDFPKKCIKKIPPLPPPMDYEKAKTLLKHINNTIKNPTQITTILRISKDEDNDEEEDEEIDEIDLKNSPISMNPPKIIDLPPELKKKSVRKSFPNSFSLSKKSKNIILNVIMPDYTHSSIYVQKKSTVKEALQKVCLKRNYNPNEYSLCINKKNQEIQLSNEQSVSSYKSEEIYLTRIKGAEIIENGNRKASLVDVKTAREIPIEEMNVNELHFEKKSISHNIAGLSHQLRSLDILFETLPETERVKEIKSHTEGKRKITQTLEFYKNKLTNIDKNLNKLLKEEVVIESNTDSGNVELKDEISFAYFRKVLSEQIQTSVSLEFWEGSSFTQRNSENIIKNSRYYHSLMDFFLDSFEVFSEICKSVESLNQLDFIVCILKLFESQSSSISLIKCIFQYEHKLITSHQSLFNPTRFIFIPFLSEYSSKYMFIILSPFIKKFASDFDSLNIFENEEPSLDFKSSFNFCTQVFSLNDYLMKSVTKFPVCVKLILNFISGVLSSQQIDTCSCISVLIYKHIIPCVFKEEKTFDFIYESKKRKQVNKFFQVFCDVLDHLICGTSSDKSYISNLEQHKNKIKESSDLFIKTLVTGIDNSSYKTCYMIEKNLSICEANHWEVHSYLYHYKQVIVKNFEVANIPKEKIENFSQSLNKIGRPPSDFKLGAKKEKMQEICEYITTNNQYLENQCIFNSFPKRIVQSEKKGGRILNLSQFKLSFLNGIEAFAQTISTLDLSNNQLTEIPESIFLLLSLRVLDLSKNSLTKIQSSLIAFLGKMDVLHLQDNPFENIFTFLSVCSKEHCKIFLTHFDACKYYQS